MADRRIFCRETSDRRPLEKAGKKGQGKWNAKWVSDGDRADGKYKYDCRNDSGD